MFENVCNNLDDFQGSTKTIVKNIDEILKLFFCRFYLWLS